MKRVDINANQNKRVQMIHNMTIFVHQKKERKKTCIYTQRFDITANQNKGTQIIKNDYLFPKK